MEIGEEIEREAKKKRRECLKGHGLKVWKLNRKMTSTLKLVPHASSSSTFNHHSALQKSVTICWVNLFSFTRNLLRSFLRLKKKKKKKNASILFHFSRVFQPKILGRDDQNDSLGKNTAMFG